MIRILQQHTPQQLRLAFVGGWALFQTFVKILFDLFEVHVSSFFADPVTLLPHKGNCVKLLLCLGWHDT